MTKFYDGQVEVVQLKAVPVQVPADSEEDAVQQAKNVAAAKEPEFRVTENVELRFVGEGDLGLGSRVVHSLMGTGVIEHAAPNPNGGFNFRVRFDKGIIKDIVGPGEELRPEALVQTNGAPYIHHYIVRLKWERGPNKLELIGKAQNKKERVDPALLAALKWFREHTSDGFIKQIQITHSANLDNDGTGVTHFPLWSYEVSASFKSDEALNRFLLMMQD
ncbi:hypothetical protein ACFPOE_09475 [Caenimonas terrae]|uniref:Uncharacterized protein n=1 Tax=Caenimonas terrae TaxID=696074 RepID=A0ABW0ND33_9BURK